MRIARSSSSRKISEAFCVGDGMISPEAGDGDDIAAADDEGEKNLRDCCGVFLCNLLYRDTLKESSAKFSALCQRAVGHGGGYCGGAHPGQQIIFDSQDAR